MNDFMGHPAVTTTRPRSNKLPTVDYDDDLPDIRRTWNWNCVL